jgi:hypothetical protein
MRMPRVMTAIAFVVAFVSPAAEAFSVTVTVK